MLIKMQIAQLKMGKYLHRHFPKGYTSGHQENKKCSASIVIKKRPSKITRYHYIPTRMAKIQTLTNYCVLVRMQNH